MEFSWTGLFEVACDGRSLSARREATRAASQLELGVVCQCKRSDRLRFQRTGIASGTRNLCVDTALGLEFLRRLRADEVIRLSVPFERRGRSVLGELHFGDGVLHHVPLEVVGVLVQ